MVRMTPNTDASFFAAQGESHEVFKNEIPSLSAFWRFVLVDKFVHNLNSSTIIFEGSVRIKLVDDLESKGFHVALGIVSLILHLIYLCGQENQQKCEF